MAFYVLSTSIDKGDLYASFGFSSRPTLMGLFLFFQAIWSPIDKESRAGLHSIASPLLSRHPLTMNMAFMKAHVTRSGCCVI